jgi:hypothetical protein
MATTPSRTLILNYRGTRRTTSSSACTKKPGELVKYFNSDSHHHRHHKTTVLSGVELRLALLTTRTPASANMSLSDIYPDKDEALWLAGQLKLGQKMLTLSAVLDDEMNSGLTRLEKKSCSIDKRDSFSL